MTFIAWQFLAHSNSQLTQVLRWFSRVWDEEQERRNSHSYESILRHLDTDEIASYVHVIQTSFDIWWPGSFSEKFSLFTSAWSVWSYLPGYFPRFVTGWLKGGRRGSQLNGQASLSKALEGKGSSWYTGRAEIFSSSWLQNYTFTVIESMWSSLCQSGGYFLPDALCHHEVKWSEVKVFQSCLTLGDPTDLPERLLLSTEFSRNTGVE